MNSLNQTLIAATLALSSVSQTFAAAPIIGGEEVSSQDPIAETTVLLYSGQNICTASLIAKDLAITAAHWARSILPPL